MSSDEAARTSCDVVVCIPTYRRPASLALLLKSVEAQSYLKVFCVVVADNDSENPSVPGVDIPPGLKSRFHWFPVEERGVSVIRDRLVKYTLDNFPSAVWLAFVDDDERPIAEWLDLMVATGNRYPSDIVGGPVIGRLPSKVPFLARYSLYSSRRRQVTGPVEMVNGTGNILVSVDFLRRLGRDPFLPELGRTGGEDYEFFLYAKSRGARFVWCDEAIVEEEVEPSRLHSISVLKRYLAISAYQARVDKRYNRFPQMLMILLMRPKWFAGSCYRVLATSSRQKNVAGALFN
ncbi:glycosyltransferase family 2 protein, partial [Aerococcus mictus]|uniref:glycosyltransferase family 2 protein n=2 Tax=Aerococcus mictus TaxID=2976810 RepID=UPI000DCD5B45